MRMRSWIFAAVVAVVLAINLGLVSLRIAQTGEETLRARVALASGALKGQLELLDARLSPRAIASSPDVIEATRPPVDPTQPLGKPDERALRAAAAALQPEPDLLIVASAQGAILSRRSKPAQAVDDLSKLPLVKPGLEGTPAPVFAAFEGALYRLAAARVPGNPAVVVVGMLIDDRLASQLRSQIDADLTILKSGLVIASSLAPDERGRVLRWAQSPAPGYGTLQVRLPLLGTSLSGKLPRGATRYAVRGALVVLDSGVQAAVTVPASPYLGWLARYQAFYLAALVLFLLFGLVWGLVAPAARTAVVAEHSLRMSPQPSLDVGGPRALTPPPAARDVPWREGEGPSGEHPVPVAPPALAQLLHDQGSLDPVVEAPIDPLLPLAAGAEDQAVKQPAVHKPHAPFAGDLFTPTPGQFAMAAEPEAFISAAAARERGEPEPGDELNLKELPPQQAEQALPAESSAAKGDFSFAGLLDEAHAAPVPVLEQRPPMSHDQPESTVPGQPSLELLARSREEPAMVAYGGLAANTTHDYFPGDEPTRIEPVSAALLDKLREKDPPEPHSSFGSEPAAPAVHNGFDSPGPSGENRQATLIDQAPLSLEAGYESSPEAAEEERDPDQVHWQETFEQFRELKASLGEPSDRITFEKFSAKLRKNREDLLAKHNCIGVRFSVYEKEGRAAIRAKAIRE